MYTTYSGTVTDLIGSWQLNDGSGSSAANSVTSAVGAGTLTNFTATEETWATALHSQTGTVTIAGTVEGGDSYTVTVDGVQVTYNVTGGEASLVDPVWDLVGSIVFGLIAGHLLILLQEQVGRENDAVPLLAIIFLTIGVCTATDVPHMLAFLVTGAVVVNRSRFFPRVTEAMSVYAQPAFVLFFVLLIVMIVVHIKHSTGGNLVIPHVSILKAIGEI